MLRGRCSKLGLEDSSYIHDAVGAARLSCSLLICKAFPMERRIYWQIKAALYFLVHFTLAFRRPGLFVL